MESNNKISRKSRGVSPVIATVILVAVAITVAVAVSYWMAGISSQYTSFEKVEIQSGHATKAAEGWTIEMTLKNTGTATATMIDVLINDVSVTGTTIAPHEMAQLTDCLTDPLPLYEATGTNILDPIPTDLKDTIESGATQTIEVYIGIDYASLTSGTTVNIKIHSAGGMDYIKLIELV